MEYPHIVHGFTGKSSAMSLVGGLSDRVHTPVDSGRSRPRGAWSDPVSYKVWGRGLRTP